MFGNFFFSLTSVAYLALLAVNLYRPNATGERLVGWGFILFGALAAYVLCSLMLTIHLANNGKLDWISATKATRNIVAVLGFVCLMTGIVVTTMVNADSNNSSTASWLGLIVIRYGAIWLPLLMLAPYAILLTPEWSSTISPSAYKIPLIVGSLIGMSFYLLSNEQLHRLFTNNEAIAEKKYQESMDQIGFSDETPDLLYYILRHHDPRVRAAALKKLKAKPDLESELLNILNRCFDGYDYFRVIVYLEENSVEHPDLFVEPLNQIIHAESEELKYRLQSFSSENDFLKMLNVDGLCRILDGQFKPYKEAFRANMQVMLAELEKEPKPDFLEIRNKYRQAVQQWLGEK